MKLSKAIEIQGLARDDPDSIPINDLFEAEDLATEVMERFNELSAWPHEYSGGPLPGETKE